MYVEEVQRKHENYEVIPSLSLILDSGSQQQQLRYQTHGWMKFKTETLHIPKLDLQHVWKFYKFYTRFPYQNTVKDRTLREQSPRTPLGRTGDIKATDIPIQIVFHAPLHWSPNCLSYKVIRIDEAKLIY